MPAQKPKEQNILTAIFCALLIDILAFTVILPLFPRILAEYAETDGEDPSSLFAQALSTIRSFKSAIGASTDFDIVLFGGWIGSLFSFLQFVSSPFVGRLSDIYGRRPVLLLSMVWSL